MKIQYKHIVYKIHPFWRLQIFPEKVIGATRVYLLSGSPGGPGIFWGVQDAGSAQDTGKLISSPRSQVPP